MIQDLLGGVLKRLHQLASPIDLWVNWPELKIIFLEIQEKDMGDIDRSTEAWNQICCQPQKP